MFSRYAKVVLIYSQKALIQLSCNSFQVFFRERHNSSESKVNAKHSNIESLFAIAIKFKELIKFSFNSDSDPKTRRLSALNERRINAIISPFYSVRKRNSLLILCLETSETNVFKTLEL